MGNPAAVPIECLPAPLEASLNGAILAIPKRWHPERQMEDRDRRVKRSHDIAGILKNLFCSNYRVKLQKKRKISKPQISLKGIAHTMCVFE